jgi:hypothetical protein
VDLVNQYEEARKTTSSILRLANLERCVKKKALKCRSGSRFLAGSLFGELYATFDRRAADSAARGTGSTDTVLRAGEHA